MYVVLLKIRVGWILTDLYQEILQKYTARQLRLAFLTQLWNTKIDFSESSMSGEVKSVETTFNVSVINYPGWQGTDTHTSYLRISLSL